MTALAGYQEPAFARVERNRSGDASVGRGQQTGGRQAIADLNAVAADLAVDWFLATAQESELAMIPAGVIYCRLRLWRLRRLPFVSRLQRGDGVKRNFKPPKVDEKRSRCQWCSTL
jgi:hypothetical protein